MQTTTFKQQLANVEQAINTLKQGGMVILTDHTDRENEGDIVFAAQYANSENINYCMQQARGIVCVSITETYCDKFNLDLLPQRFSLSTSANFTVSIDASKNITTGVSAADRAETIRVLLDENSELADLSTPGHVFPLKAKTGGVFERQGHTEGSIDLMRLADLQPAAVICEIVNSDGTMARADELLAIAERDQLPIVSIDEIITYRQWHEQQAEFKTETIIPTTKYGALKASVFINNLTHEEAIVLQPENTQAQEVTLVRIHSSCFTGDLLSSLRCDCGSQLNYAMHQIVEQDGLIIYLPQEGRSIGLANKLAAYHLQDQGYDTVEANLALGFAIDQREYDFAAKILLAMNKQKIKLLSNNPDKIDQLAQYGITVQEQVTIPAHTTKENLNYLQTKKNKLGHVIDDLN